MLERREKETVWSQKYRPSKISELILPDRFKVQLQAMVDKGSIQNCLFAGSAGTGKTTAALALCDELGLEYLMINASENGNIDTLRTLIRNYASSVSFNGKKKVVILDEGDFLNAQSTQPALRNFLEEFSSNVSFIMTANFKNRLIAPLLSRFAVYDFEFTKEEKGQLLQQFDKRVKFILEENSIEYDKKTLALLLVKYFPDFRKILNELQRNCQTGTLSTNFTNSNEAISELIKFLKEKDFANMRKWVAANSDLDFSIIQKNLYDKSYEIMKPESIPQLILHLAEYDYRNAFVIDKEINIAAMLLLIMSECEFK